MSSEQASDESELKLALAHVLNYYTGVAFSVCSSREVEGVSGPEIPELLGREASEERRFTFLRGREAARRAMVQLQVGNSFVVGRGSRREPLWPAGLTGSISHCDSYSIAVVARQSDLRSVGIDIANARHVEERDIRAQVGTPAEFDRIAANEGVASATAIVVSAKEAIFKTLYPMCHAYVDFLDVEITPGGQPGDLFAELLKGVSPEFRRGQRLLARSVRFGDYVISVCGFHGPGRT